MERPTCPKCGYTRQANDASPTTECPRCGIVFAKYAQFLADKAAGKPTGRQRRLNDDDADDDHALIGQFKAAIYAAPSKPDSVMLLSECLLLLGLAIWGGWFVAADWRTGEAGMSFLHQVNLPFHEFGHVLFRPFGQWMMFLGGSLFQCLIPLGLAGVFVFRERQPFSGAVCLWWVGQNLIDLAPYIGDARSMDLPLIGEWSEEAVEMRYLRHDWHNILEPLNLLAWDHRFASLAHWLGSAIMLAAWSFGAWWVWRHWQALREAQVQ